MLVHAYLCVFELYEMEKAGIGLHRVGGGYTVKNERKLASDCFYILLQQAARKVIGGRLMNENREHVYISYAAGK